MQKIFENKIVKWAINIVEIILFIAILAYLIFVIAQRVTNNSSILGYRVFTVATGSMNPKYKINDVIIVRDVDPDKLKVGDDIAYKGERGGLEGILVSHRIIKIETADNGKRRFYTKGINNSIQDPSFDEDRIIGMVKGKLPIINELNHIVKNQFGFFFFVFTPLVLVIFLEIAETITNMRIEKGELELSNKEDDEVEDYYYEDSQESVEKEEVPSTETVEELKEKPQKIKAKEKVEEENDEII